MSNCHENSCENTNKGTCHCDFREDCCCQEEVKHTKCCPCCMIKHVAFIAAVTIVTIVVVKAIRK